MTDLSHLFAPITMGTMTAPNRLMMPAMSINFGVDDQGFVTAACVLGRRINGFRSPVPNRAGFFSCHDFHQGGSIE